MSGTRERQGDGRGAGKRLRTLAPGRAGRLRPLAGALVAALLVLAALPASGSAAEVRLLRNATSEFDRFITDPSPAAQAWMRSHYAEMRGYAPYFDNNAFEWSPPPTSFYRDLYAIYNQPAGNQLIASHPDWVLRDGAGRPLYIPYACSGGTCPQYAGDVGNPAFRAHWIAGARHTFDESRTRSPDGSGYMGIFIDDVNLEMKVGNGDGELVAPIDPRTGSTMTRPNWQRYVAEFTEEIRAAFPAAQITHNPLWWLPHSDPQVRRQVAAADVIELERGFNDAGLTGGGGKYGYNTFLKHISWLHRRGRKIVVEPYLETKAQARYELAGYLLARRPGDSIASRFRTEPPVSGGKWWRHWRTDPGRPRSHRKQRGGVWIRRYGRGTAVVNPPGAGTKTIRFERARRSLSGKVSRRFRLGPRKGDFFRKRRRG
jgi:Hypothetical glycosyl hydrolase family 15